MVWTSRKLNIITFWRTNKEIYDLRFSIYDLVWRMAWFVPAPQGCGLNWLLYSCNSAGRGDNCEYEKHTVESVKHYRDSGQDDSTGKEARPPCVRSWAWPLFHRDEGIWHRMVVLLTVHNARNSPFAGLRKTVGDGRPTGSVSSILTTLKLRFASWFSRRSIIIQA